MASDNFNRANETPLASPWASDSVFGGMNLVSNQARAPGSTDVVSYRSDSATAFSRVEVDFGTNAAASPALHCDGAGSYYSVVASDASGGFLSLWLALAGEFTELDSAPWTAAAFTSMTLLRDGDDLVLLLDDVEVRRWEDETTLTGGYDGIASWDSAKFIDNWSNHSPETADMVVLATDDFPASIDAGWVNGPGAASDLEWVSSGVVGAYNANQDSVAVRASGAYTADQFSEVTVQQHLSEGWIGAVVRCSDSTGACYLGAVSADSGFFKYTIYKTDNSFNFTQLANSGSGTGTGVPSGTRVLLKASGSTITLYTIDGGVITERLSVNDSDLTTGRPGIVLWAPSGNKQNARISSWRGGVLSGATPASVEVTGFRFYNDDGVETSDGGS